MEDSRHPRPLGRVVALTRYPVKSMAGEDLSDVEVGWHGFAGDRRWAFVRNDVPQSGFPWITLRQRADMSHYRPTFDEPEKPDASRTRVRTPTGAELDVTDPALAQELYPEGARVLRQDRGSFDAFPLSLITTRTIERLGETVGTELDMRRFRPNVVVETEREAAFLEDGWVGSVLRIGQVRMRVDKRDGRCVVITIDPETTERNPTVLEAVARDREGCLGVYGSVVEPGRIALNDPVILETPGANGP